MPIGQPTVERNPAVGNGERFVVGEVICFAHEGVDGANRVPLARRQGNKGVIEILCLLARDRPADRVGCLNLGGHTARLPRETPGKSLPHIARANSPSFLVFEMTGRMVSTSYCRR